MGTNWKELPIGQMILGIALGLILVQFAAPKWVSFIPLCGAVGYGLLALLMIKFPTAAKNENDGDSEDKGE